MSSLNTTCKLCDAVVRVEATIEEIRTMDTFQACARLGVAFDQHLTDHVEGIIAVLENARG